MGGGGGGGDPFGVSISLKRRVRAPRQHKKFSVLRLGVLETAQLALTFSFLFFMGNYSYQV
jgi:hypothetical protein